MAIDGQRRAAPGGEVGANGEWYEGGKFIATKDNPKTAPARWDESPAAAADREAGERRAAEIAALLAHGSPDDLYENFYVSMGRQLREAGSLSRRQAVCAVKGIHGRRTVADPRPDLCGTCRHYEAETLTGGHCTDPAPNPMAAKACGPAFGCVCHVVDVDRRPR